MHEIVKKEIDWLDSIPENWTVIRNKSIFKNVSIRNHGDSEVLSLYRDLGVVPKNSRDDNHNVTSLDTDGYKFVEKGDLVINKMKAWSGSVAISDYEGIVSPAYYICKVDYSLVEQRFIHHYLRNPGIVEAYEMYSAGMRIGQWDLSIDDFLKIMVAIPNKTVQKNIAKTLDNKLNQVDALISNQEAQIEKLKAYKQSLIAEVVTKGLDPNAPTKDSGNEWIGNVSINAQITRVGHLFDIILGKMLAPESRNESDTLEEYFCAANIHFDGIQYDNLKKMWFSPDEKTCYVVRKGDLLVVEGGAGAGGSYVVDKEVSNNYVQNSVMIVRAKSNISEKWLYYMMYMLVKSGFIDYVCHKATIPHFTKDKLGNTPVVYYSPEVIENLVEILDKKCVEIDKLISIKVQKIEKLNQYKKSLIYEYVTGKKEVM